jgi:serine/threonine protein kinase
MAFLSDKAIERLRSAGEVPDFSATRYALVEFLASGGMGAVYLAEDRVLGRRVAVKILEATDPDGSFAERLNKEAHVLAQLEHPGIVPVHDAGSLPDGRAFYVMKFVQGSRLDQFLGGVLSLSERLRLFLRVCEAVSFAHSRDILHRDLKPSNVMVGAFGEVLVMDWGLAKVLSPNAMKSAGRTIPGAVSSQSAIGDSAVQESAATRDGIVMGTPGYMSPEQERGNASVLDQRSDVFSLGKVLEFVAFSAATSSGTALPKSLRAICNKATASDREQRYASVTDLAGDISRYLDGAPVSAYRENLWERALRFYTRHQVAILLIGMYLLMRTLFVLFGRR